MEGCALPKGQQEKLKEVINRHPKVFAEHERHLGCTNLITHYVKINSNQPINTSYYKAQRPEIREEINDQTESMITDGVVKGSESPYCVPIVLVHKKDGGWQYCVDLRKLNNVTDKTVFPLPKIEDAL